MNNSEIRAALAARARTARELLSLAKAEGLSLTENEAQVLFQRLHHPIGELSDHELEAVSGGGCNCGGNERKCNPTGVGIGDTVHFITPALAPHIGDGKRCDCNDFFLVYIDRTDTPDSVNGYRCRIKCQKCFREDIITNVGLLSNG